MRPKRLFSKPAGVSAVEIDHLEVSIYPEVGQGTEDDYWFGFGFRTLWMIKMMRRCCFIGQEIRR
jgi:hypothetical protein